MLPIHKRHGNKLNNIDFATDSSDVKIDPTVYMEKAIYYMKSFMQKYHQYEICNLNKVVSTHRHV